MNATTHINSSIFTMQHWISSRFDFGKSNRQRLPERICRPNIPPCLSEYQGQWWNGKRPHGPILARQTINKNLHPSRKPTSIPTRFQTNWHYGTTPPGTFQCQDSHCLHDHYRNHWIVFQWSVGPVPHHIQQRQKLCHRLLHLRCKLCEIRPHSLLSYASKTKIECLLKYLLDIIWIAALSKFLVLLALCLLASHANALTSLSSVAGNQVRIIHLILLQQPMSDPTNEPSFEPICKPTKWMNLDAKLPSNLSSEKTRVAHSEPKQDSELPSKITDSTITQTCGLCHNKSEPESSVDQPGIDEEISHLIAVTDSS